MTFAFVAPSGSGCRCGGERDFARSELEWTSGV